MKVLHTADWHVGKTIRGRSRDDEHRQVLSEIARIAGDGRVDLIIVAGDVFDTAAPAAAAEEIVYRAFLEMAQVAPVVIVGGNHDNPARLRAVAPLLRLGRVTVGSQIVGPADGGIVTVPGLPVRMALVPFIGKRGIVRVVQILSLDAGELAGEYAERVKRIIETLCEPMGTDTVNILVGHLMVLGGKTGGGERTSHLFDYAIPALSFPGHLSYVALGHLHRTQKVPAPAPIWYSGSPLQLDFGEEEDVKSVTVVEVEPGLPAVVEIRRLTSGKRLRTLRGTLAEVTAQASEVGDDFLRVELDEKARTGLHDDVRELFPGAVEVRLTSSDGSHRSEDAPRRLGRDPSELFLEYLTSRSVEDPDLVGLFSELLAESHET